MSAINLFCLPYAGGSKSAYHHYIATAPSSVKIIPLELPGRGSRYREPLLTQLQLMEEDIVNQIRHQLTAPYAIYGHSMGALLAFLVTRRIEDEQLPLPLHLFVTGSGSPLMPERKRKIYLLEKEQFVAELRAMGGIPNEILEDDKLLDLFLPILRADFTATQTFIYQRTKKITIPVTVVTGSDEEISTEQIEEWRQETTGPVDIQMLPGNHFFILKYAAEIMELVTKKLAQQTGVPAN